MISKEQKLIDILSDKLPIKVFPERNLLPKLRETFNTSDIKLDTIFEVQKMFYLGDEGGLCCEIIPLGFTTSKDVAAFICSITHLRIKVGEPFFTELESYRSKRIKRLEKQNRTSGYFNINLKK